MTSKRTEISPEVVNAFVTSLKEVFKAATGLDAVLEPVKMASDLPPPPSMNVTIELSGTVFGLTIWTFEPGIARAIAEHMYAGTAKPTFESPECKDAVGEVANILAGNVSGALFDAGYPVELSPPQTEAPTEPQKLDEPTVELSLNTKEGTMNVVLAVTQA